MTHQPTDPLQSTERAPRDAGRSPTLPGTARTTRRLRERVQALWQARAPLAQRPVGRGLIAAALIAATAAVLVWLLRDLPVAALQTAVQQVPLAVWALAALAWLATYGIRALRLQHEWAASRAVPLRVCLRLVLTHNAAVLLMPLRSGEAAYLWLVHRQWGIGWVEAGRSLLWLRWQDATVLACAGVALLGPGSASERLLLATAAAAFSVWGMPALCRATARHLPRLSLPRWMGVVGHASAKIDWMGWGCCAANWALRLAVVATLLSQIAHVDTAAGLSAAMGAELGTALPIQGPAGLGNYELGVHAAALRLGLAPAGLVGAALVVHLFCLAVSLLAAGVAQVAGALRAVTPTLASET